MHIYTHPACLKHDPPPQPGLAPLRLEVVIDALREIDGLQWHEPPALKAENIALIHTPVYVAEVLKPIAPGSKRAFTSDTVAVSGTAEAALHAASIAVTATQDVLSGKADKALCLVSPGGHHAEADGAGGFCFFNNVALAAITTEKKLGATRVAVVDFDAHHGNGTQSFFWNFENRLFISLHEETRLSGLADETGAWNNIVNIPLPKGSSGRAVQNAFADTVIPKVSAFKPDILFVSAGFDMHKDDPLSHLLLDTADYAWLGRELKMLADHAAHGRLVAVLEGGYNPKTLGQCAAAFVTGLIK